MEAAGCLALGACACMWSVGPGPPCPGWEGTAPLGSIQLLPCPAGYHPCPPLWLQVSGEAKDLVSKLLVVDPASRLTCQQVGGNDACPVGLPDATELLRPGM